MNQQQMVVANNGYNPLPSFQQNKLYVFHLHSGLSSL